MALITFIAKNASILQKIKEDENIQKIINAVNAAPFYEESDLIEDVTIVYNDCEFNVAFSTGVDIFLEKKSNLEKIAKILQIYTSDESNMSKAAKIMIELKSGK